MNKILIFMRSGPPAKKIVLSAREIHILRQFVHARKTNQGLAMRAIIILYAWQQKLTGRIAQLTHHSRTTVQLWRDRYAKAYTQLQTLLKTEVSNAELRVQMTCILSDAPRTGAHSRITPEQKIAIVGLACEPLPQPFVPQSQWDATAVAAEAIRRNIVDQISASYVCRLLERVELKPHRCRYWMNPKVDVNNDTLFKKPVQQICELYRSAQDLMKQGTHLICVDEKTGIQAIEHLKPALLARPGKIECIEPDYKRHGTETDFITHITQTLDIDPAGHWIFILDNLNTHMSEGLVRLVAQRCEIPIELGIKGKTGILSSKKSRSTFLQDPTHRIRFVFTPKHCSWLNQIEMWFGILTRKVIQRGNFLSLEDLDHQILAYITQYNQIKAHPFRWTWAGTPLIMT
jgi:transposase